LTDVTCGQIIVMPSWMAASRSLTDTLPDINNGLREAAPSFGSDDQYIPLLN
jgi:hypothetical protein